MSEEFNYEEVCNEAIVKALDDLKLPRHKAEHKRLLAMVNEINDACLEITGVVIDSEPEETVETIDQDETDQGETGEEVVNN